MNIVSKLSIQYYTDRAPGHVHNNTDNNNIIKLHNDHDLLSFCTGNIIIIYSNILYFIIIFARQNKT